MTLSLLLILLFLQSGMTADDLKDYDLMKFISLFRSLTEYRPNDVNPDDVTFYLFTRNISNLEIPLESHDNIDLTKDTKFIIHGYIDNHNRSWYNKLTIEYLKKGDFNVIQVDWHRVASSLYPSSAKNSILVGQLLSRFILNHNLGVKQIHLIGHSLGAHIAGFAAQNIKNATNKKIRRISALDPAGPGFRGILITNENRVDAEDADIVDVTHTDGGFLGYYFPLGTFDIYINGGMRIQPDCVINLTHIASPGELFEDSYCSHAQAYVRFIEIINEVKYTCRKCASWLNFVIGLCESNEEYEFGAEDIDEHVTGVCFVNT